MTYLDDLKARWEANERRANANRQAFIPSLIEIRECAERRDELCRELVAQLATANATELADWPRIAELIEAARIVSPQPERNRPCSRA